VSPSLYIKTTNKAVFRTRAKYLWASGGLNQYRCGRCGLWGAREYMLPEGGNYWRRILDL
jgi:hypothetical protein